ncbi:uncharacterized protein [Diadema setosum]|uniref:uncharacterized protein n=1 Tax=Diadema setosum TaxID=31175 RepID=UPI003B3B1539
MMAKSVWILVITLCWLALVCSGGKTDILEKEQAIEVGTNLTLHCAVNRTLTNHTANDIIWMLVFDNRVPEKHTRSVLNDNIGQLHIINASLEDEGAYFCGLPNESYNDYKSSATTIRIGYKPLAVTNLTCWSTNIDTFTCSWEDGRKTNLNTKDTLYYQRMLPQSNSKENISCGHETQQQQGKPNHCTIGNQGHRTPVWVVTENQLGSALTSLGQEFNPFTEVRPKPPADIRMGQPSENGQLEVNWSTPDDWNPLYGLEYWIQYRIKDSSEWEDISYDYISGLSKIIHPLRPYTEYTVRMKCAYDILISPLADTRGADVFGEWSQEIHQRTRAEVPRAPITGFEMDVNDDQTDAYKRIVYIEWHEIPESDHYGSGFGYRISISFRNGTVHISENTKAHTLRIEENEREEINTTLRNIDKFQEYTLTVTPYNEVGDGSSVISRDINDGTRVPSEPEVVTTTFVNATAVTVAWEEPATISGYITRYDLQWKEKDVISDWDGATQTDVNNRMFTIGGLNQATEYHIRVSTVNKKGDSDWRSVFATTSEAEPDGSPRSVTVESIGDSPTKLKISWHSPHVDYQNGRISHYTISYCKTDVSEANCQCQNASEKTIHATEDEQSTYFLRDLQPFTEYCIRISASTAAGPGPYSDVSRGMTSQGSPSSPTDLRKTFFNASTIHVTWKPPTELNGVLRSYKVSYNGQTKEVVNTSAVLDVNGFTNYSVAVQACSHGSPSVACSPFTTSVYVQTDIGAPSQVKMLELRPHTSEAVFLEWNRPVPPNGPIAYYVARSRPADSEEDWLEVKSLTTQTEVKVNCDLVKDGRKYVFQVYAVNEIDGSPLPGIASPLVDFEMCNIHKGSVSTVLLAVIIPVILLFVIIALFILLWFKQSDFFKPAPDPYFIEAVLDQRDEKFQMKGRLLGLRAEKENFDTLRQADSTTNLLLPPFDRSSSKESTSTSSSTDQGIHDMDGFSDEMRYVREKTSSRNHSESEENKLHGKCKMPVSDDYEADDTVFSGHSTRQDDGDGSVAYSRIAEVEGADAPDSSTPMLNNDSVHYLSDGSEAYAQLSQVTPQGSTTPAASVRGLSDQRSEASFGSQSTVNYHRLGLSGLTPITSVETLPSEEPLAYSRLSQGSEADIEYSQLAATSSNPSLTGISDSRASHTADGRISTSCPSEDAKGVAMSLPSISAANGIQPPQEIIVATALAPGSHPHPVSEPDSTGYVTTSSVAKLAQSSLKPSTNAPKDNFQGIHQSLADSKSQSGSDSSLTDGEGYSTLGIAYSPSSTPVQHHHPKAVLPSARPSSTTPVSVSSSSNGYIPNDTTLPPPVQPAQCRTKNVPLLAKPTASGYVTESDMKAILLPPSPQVRDHLEGSDVEKPEDTQSPRRCMPNGLTRMSENGYVTSDNIPLTVSAPSVLQASSIMANPYIPHEQAVQGPSEQRSPPTTPTTALNNNQPMPTGKKLCLDDPYVGNNVKPTSPGGSKVESTVC